ncbi:serine hydrolase domain-containing protein [Nocardia sp. NPDC004711]
MNPSPGTGANGISRRSALGAGSALLAAGALVACTKTSSSSTNTTTTTSPKPAPDNEQIATSVLDPTPENQAATFRNFDRQSFATRVIRTDKTRTKPFPRSNKSLDGLHYTFNGTDRTLDRYASDDNRIAGLLVLKDGAIVHERYGMGNNETSRWTSWSIAKSFTGSLVGAALVDKSIGSLDDPITRYVSELKDSPYQDNTIRQLLQMSSGLRWTSEPYTLYGDSDIARLFQAAYSNRAGAVMDLMITRPRVAAPGVAFNYANGDTYVLGAVVAKATGKNLSDYLSQKIWQPLGMEADGYWMLDSPGGLEMGGNNLSATLRDYGRFGQFILGGGEGVLPKGWRDEAGQPHSATTGYGKLPYSGYPGGYGYQWWCYPPGVAGAHGPTPTFEAEGVYGQKLYINPSDGVVVVQWAAWPAEGSQNEKEYLAVVDAIVNALR